jgi:hypothetical protein
MIAKQQLFDQARGGLKERSAYFSRDSIQAVAEAAGLALKRPTLAVYLNEVAAKTVGPVIGLPAAGHARGPLGTAVPAIEWHAGCWSLGGGSGLRENGRGSPFARQGPLCRGFCNPVVCQVVPARGKPLRNTGGGGKVLRLKICGFPTSAIDLAAGSAYTRRLMPFSSMIGRTPALPAGPGFSPALRAGDEPAPARSAAGQPELLRRLSKP